MASAKRLLPCSALDNLDNDQKLFLIANVGMRRALGFQCSPEFLGAKILRLVATQDVTKTPTGTMQDRKRLSNVEETKRLHEQQRQDCNSGNNTSFSKTSPEIKTAYVHYKITGAADLNENEKPAVQATPTAKRMHGNAR